MESEDADVELMLRLRAGDDTALNGLISRWKKPLTAFIYRYVGNEHEALDIAQETFVRVYENRHRYQVKSKFSTWLFTIAVNLCRNYARWRRNHPAVSLEDAQEHSDFEIAADREVSPGTALANRELAEAVRQAVQSLPHDLLTVILLFEYEDLSYREIAAILGSTDKVVEMRLYRARKLLREKLAGWFNR
jgi:RNA polymerase sigma-70 factor (ECF subfamily)